MEKKDKSNLLMRWLDFTYTRLTGRKDKSNADLFWFILFTFTVIITMALLLKFIVSDINITVSNILLFSTTGIMLGIMWQYIFRNPTPWIKKLMPIIGVMQYLIIFSLIILNTGYPIVRQLLPENKQENAIVPDTVKIAIADTMKSTLIKKEDSSKIVDNRFEFILNGRIQNTKRKGIANLKVILENKSNNLLFELKTDEKGYYRTSFLYDKSEINFLLILKDIQNNTLLSRNAVFNNNITTTLNLEQ